MLKSAPEHVGETGDVVKLRIEERPGSAIRRSVNPSQEGSMAKVI
jgi:hypothetical protein